MAPINTVPTIPRDPGLQRERSQLAWTRSALALTANTLLLIKIGLFSALQVGLLVVAVGWLLTTIAQRKDEIASQVDLVHRKMIMRNLWIAMSVSLSALTVCLYHLT